MGWYEADVYSNPEKFGLSLLGSVDIAGDYEFDMVAVWQRNSDGALFFDYDSGCSCPSPFEEVKDVESLQPMSDVTAFVNGARSWFRNAQDSSWHSAGSYEKSALERLIVKVKRRAKGDAR
jgi:hypothetical protein